MTSTVHQPRTDGAYPAGRIHRTAWHAIGLGAVVAILPLASHAADVQAPARVAAQPVYRVTAVPWTDQVEASDAIGINNAGVAVGIGAHIPDGGHHAYSRAYRYDNGVTTRLRGAREFAAAVNEHNEIVGGETKWNANGKPSSLGSPADCNGRVNARDINDAGKAVGEILCPQGQTAGLFYKGKVRDLGVLKGHRYAIAFAINNQDQVVGQSTKVIKDAPGSMTRAFLWEHGAMRDLGTLGGLNSNAMGVNQLGHIVGNAQDAAGVNLPFLHDGQTMAALPACDARETHVYDINNHDQVVGALFTDQLDGRRAVLIDGGQCYPLQSLLDESGTGWVLSLAHAINDDGTIVGTGEFQGVVRGFVATRVTP